MCVCIYVCMGLPIKVLIKNKSVAALVYTTRIPYEAARTVACANIFATLGRMCRLLLLLLFFFFWLIVA